MSHGQFEFVPDLPSSDPVLGFPAYADALASAIADTVPAQFTVGIYGPWGSGKSSLLKAIAARLALMNPRDVLIVEFDAWRYQRNQELVVPLLHAVYRRLAEEQDTTLLDSMKRLIRAVGLSMSFRVPVVGPDISLEDLRRTWAESDALEATLDEAFALPFENLREVGRGLGHRRIVILVDDLDRCSVDTVTAMLESINVITDVAGFVFVLALDYDVIVRAVAATYPTVNGHQFVEKIIQVPFRIPSLDASEDALLTTIVPAMELGRQMSTDDRDLARMVNLAFGANPRSTKRFVNALNLILNILDRRGADVEPHVVAALLAGELRWPDEFSDVRTAARAGDANPMQTLLDPASHELAAFAEAFLATDIATSVLTTVLRLTGTVTGQEAQPDPEADESFRALTERNRARLEGAITERGYELAAQSHSLWYLPGRREHRLRFARQVVRVETTNPRRFPPDWALDRSFSIGREADEFLEHVDSHLLA